MTSKRTLRPKPWLPQSPTTQSVEKRLAGGNAAWPLLTFDTFLASSRVEGSNAGALLQLVSTVAQGGERNL